MAQRMQIKNGPSKFDLFLSLMEQGNGSNPVFFEVELKNGSDYIVNIKVNVKIDGLQAEDGSGYCWLFTGYRVISSEHVRVHEVIRDWWEVKGFYSTKTREGWIEAGRSSL